MPRRGASALAQIGEAESVVADIAGEPSRTLRLAALFQLTRSEWVRCRATFPTPACTEIKTYRVGPVVDRLPQNRRALGTYLAGKAARGASRPEDIFSRTSPRTRVEIELRRSGEGRLPERSTRCELLNTVACPPEPPFAPVAPRQIWDLQREHCWSIEASGRNPSWTGSA